MKIYDSKTVVLNHRRLKLSGNSHFYKIKRAASTGTFVFLLLILFSAMISCSGARANSDRLAMIVATGEGAVYRSSLGGEAMPAKVGVILKKGSRIETNQGSIDIQTRSGNLVRLSSYTILTIDEILESSTRLTSMELQQGVLDAVVQKASQDEAFQVRTPTSIASVRGTKFRVQTGENGRPSVRVYEGSISFAPDVPEEVKKNYEVILEKDDLSEFSSDLNEAVQTYKKQTGNRKSPAKDEIPRLPSPETSIHTRIIELDGKEKAIVATLSPLDQELVESAIDGAGSKGEDQNASLTASVDAVKKIEQLQNENRDRAVEEIQELTGDEGLKTEMEIAEHYKILEVLHTKKGEVFPGAVVTQIGDTLIVHTTGGVRRIEKHDVDYVELKNY